MYQDSTGSRGMLNGELCPSLEGYWDLPLPES